MSALTFRDELAKEIIKCIIASDWRFDTANESWDTLASRRAYTLADEMIKARDYVAPKTKPKKASEK